MIFLHGWGQNKETFNNITKNINNSTIYQLDLIGFGESHEPYKPFNLNNYCLFLEQFIKDLNIKNPILIGHSFGGRIAIKYASRNKNIKKLILINSAGIKQKSIKRSLLVLKYKIKKKYYQITRNLIKYNQITNTSGSIDYINSTPIMKATLSKIVNEDLKKDMRKIKTNTLLIWGKNDLVTPYKDAILMNKIIKNSKLITLNTDHFSYLKKEKDVTNIINTFIGSD